MASFTKRDFLICGLFLLQLAAGHYSVQASSGQALFEPITVDAGLSHTQINDILQDRQGFVWFATRNGLDRYDGFDLIHYKKEANPPFQISDNLVLDLFEDDRGCLWIGTADGLDCLDPVTGLRTVYRPDPAEPGSISNRHILKILQSSEGFLWIGTAWGLNKLDPVSGKNDVFYFGSAAYDSADCNRLWDLVEDKDNNLWIATDGGVFHFFPKTGTHQAYRPPLSDSVSLPGANHVRALAIDSTQALWIGSQAGLFVMTPGTTGFRHFEYTPNEAKSISKNRISCIFFDQTGHTWIGTEWGLNRLSPSTQAVEKFFHDPVDAFSLSNSYISTIYESRENILWFGTYHAGVNKYVPSKQHFRHYPFLSVKDSEGAVDNNITSLCEDQNGLLWIGAYSGLFIWHPESNHVERMTQSSNPDSWLPGNFIQTIMADSSGNIWVGTYQNAHCGLARYNPRTGKSTRFIHDPNDENSISSTDINVLFQDHSGNIWIGTDGKGLNRFNPPTQSFRRYQTDYMQSNQIAGNWIHTISEDYHGILWIGTDNGLSRFDHISEKFENYYHDSDDTTSILGSRVNAVFEDSHKRLWIGTESGLNLYNPALKNFFRFKRLHELSDKMIYDILEDDAGDLWFSTNNGIIRYNPLVNRLFHFDSNEGLKVLDYNVNSSLKSSSGDIYIGGKQGLVGFNPSEFGTVEVFPAVALTDFRISNRSVQFQSALKSGKAISIEYKNNSLMFAFALLDYTSPEKNRLAYRLDGFDTDWIEIPGRHFVDYTNLAPGDYTFRVRGANSLGTWSDKDVALNLHVKSPYWRSTWFQLILVILAVFILTLFYRMRIRQHEKQQKELSETVAQRTRELALKNTELEHTKDEYQILFNNAPIGYQELDKNGIILRVNQTEADMLGYSIQEMVGRPVFDFVAEEEKKSAQEKFFSEVSRIDGIEQFERKYVRKDGKFIYFSLYNRLFVDDSNKTIVRTGLVDISEKKILEEHLLQSQKMEAIGRLAGGVAHDFNNLLTVIRGHTSLVRAELSPDNPLHEDIELIDEAGQKAEEITQRLLTFSRKQNIKPEIIDLNQLIRGLNKILHRLIGEEIQFMIDLADSIPMIEADPGQIEQIIMNLAINARDAMSNGGRLLIQTRQATLDESYSEQHLDITPGQYTQLLVHDTGIGMDKETRDHIFEPFFTTKDKSKGTGLGLPMVYGIVKQSQGTIQVYSEPGTGSTFKIYFPAVEGVKTEKPVPPTGTIVASGSETILILEDEENVRRFAVRALQKFGYDILEAADYESAMTVLDKTKKPIHLILSDVIMPNMNGPEIVKHIVPRYPEVKILFMSGYNDDLITDRGLIRDDVNFLQKPFSLQDLIEKVREVLDG